MFARTRCSVVSGIVLTISVLLSSFSYSQKDAEWLQVGITTEYRITPIYLGTQSSPYYGVSGRYYDQDSQLAGGAVGFDVRKPLFRDKVDLSYGARFSYGHLLFERAPAQGLNPSVNAWTVDHLFAIAYRIRFSDHDALRVALGFALMNRGSTYATSEVDTLINGQTITYTYSGNFNFNADLLAVNYSRGPWEIGITTYYVGEADTHDNPSGFVLIAPSLRYMLGLRPKGAASPTVP